MRVFDFVFASRPMLQLPIWTIYLVALHYHNQLSRESFDWRDLVMMLCISLFGAAACYLNQVFDCESDRINDKVGFLQRGYLTHNQLLAGFLVAGLLPFAMVPVFRLITLFVFGQFFLLAYLYSAPPFRFKDRAFWGLLANAWGYGLLVSFSVMPDITVNNAGLLGWDNPFYFLLAVAAVHVLTTIPDREGDAATGKRTIAVLFGRAASLVTALVFLGLSLWMAYRSDHALLVYLSLFASIFVLAALAIPSPAIVRLAAKAPILLLTLLACFWYPAYAVFVAFLIVVTRVYYVRRFGIIYPQMH